jgi:hypothetical protein
MPMRLETISIAVMSERDSSKPAPRATSDAARAPHDGVLMAWTGQWKTDIFDLSGQVSYVREKLG